MKLQLVSASPHIASQVSTKNIMLDVLIALAPCVIAAAAVFGLYPLVVVLFSVAGAVLGEFLFNKIRHQAQTLGDLSAIVTGVILGLNLPPVVPLYVPLIGGLFATMVVKMLFGGLGKNFANPAIVARIFLLLSWGGVMTAYVAPVDWSRGFMALFSNMGSGVDAVTSATPLSYINAGDYAHTPIAVLFLGGIGGSAGEVCVPAILLGGLYLAIKRVIDIRIPLTILGTAAVCALVFNGFNFAAILPNLFAGGLLFGAVYMATDYATSPNTKAGIYIYAIGIGLMTMLVRRFANMLEGMSFAILFMNIVAPLLDKYIVPHPFGYVKPQKPKKEAKA